VEGEALTRLAGLLLLLTLAACTTHVNGLFPVYPAADDGRVDSLTPTLDWEPFPERDDPHVTEVVYDLRIMNLSGAEVYSRQGLIASSHTLEQPLASGTEYLWTVRVRFRWDGRRRETQWTTLAGSSGGSLDAGGPSHFLPLRSPSAKGAP